MAEQSSERKGFALRLNPSIADQIARIAAAEFRSANAQIEMMLRRSQPLQDNALDAPSMPPRGSERKSIALRLPSTFLNHLSEQALGSGRSLNAHIEMILARALSARGSLGHTPQLK